MSIDVEHPRTVTLYKRRWAFLLVLSTLTLLNGLSYSCFGQISNFYVQFFDVTYIQVDWLTLAPSVAPAVTTLPLAWLAYKRYLGFRLLVLCSAIPLAVGFALFVVSTFGRGFFLSLVIGQVCNGFSSQALFTTPGIFAALWFPENQVGSAISLNICGTFIGYVAGLVIPSNVLYLNYTNCSDCNELLKRDNELLRSMYLCYMSISVVISILLLIFVTDRPPTPPTIAQIVKLETPDEGKPSNGFWKSTLSVVTNRTLIIAFVVGAVALQSSTVEFTMMSEILKPHFINHDVMGAYAMTVYCVGCAMGCFLGGWVVNLYKGYRWLTIAGNGMNTVSNAVIVISVYIFSYPWLCVGNFLFGVACEVIGVTLVEVVTQETYPTDETFVMVVFTAPAYLAAIFFGEIGRLVYLRWNGPAVLVFQAANALLGFLLSFFLKPRNRRLEVEESQPLLLNSEDNSPNDSVVK